MRRPASFFKVRAATWTCSRLNIRALRGFRTSHCGDLTCRCGGAGDRGGEAASAIQKSAAKIGNDVGGFVTGIERLLTQAQAALGDVEAEVALPCQAKPSESGAA